MFLEAYCLHSLSHHKWILNLLSVQSGRVRLVATELNTKCSIIGENVFNITPMPSTYDNIKRNHKFYVSDRVFYYMVILFTLEVSSASCDVPPASAQIEQTNIILN